MTDGRRGDSSRVTSRGLALLLVGLALGAVLLVGTRSESNSVHLSDPMSRAVTTSVAGAEAVLVGHLPTTADRVTVVRSSSTRWAAARSLESLLWLVLLLGIAGAALTGCGARRADGRAQPARVRALLPSRRGPPHLV